MLASVAPVPALENDSQVHHNRVRKSYQRWLLSRGSGDLSPKERRDRLYEKLDYDPDLSPAENEERRLRRTPAGWARDCFKICKDSKIRETAEWIQHYRNYAAQHPNEQLISRPPLGTLRTDIDRSIDCAVASLRDRIDTRFNSMWPLDLTRPPDGRYAQLRGQIWEIVNAELEDLESEADLAEGKPAPSHRAKTPVVREPALIEQTSKGTSIAQDNDLEYWIEKFRRDKASAESLEALRTGWQDAVSAWVSPLDHLQKAFEGYVSPLDQIKKTLANVSFPQFDIWASWDPTGNKRKAYRVVFGNDAPSPFALELTGVPVLPKSPTPPQQIPSNGRPSGPNTVKPSAPPTDPLSMKSVSELEITASSQANEATENFIDRRATDPVALQPLPQPPPPMLLPPEPSIDTSNAKRRKPGPRPMENLDLFRAIVERHPDWESDPMELALNMDDDDECAPPKKRSGGMYRSWVELLGEGKARDRDRFRKCIRRRLK